MGTQKNRHAVYKDKSVSLGPDQNVGLDLNPHCLTLIFLKEFFEKIFLKKKKSAGNKSRALTRF